MAAMAAKEVKRIVALAAEGWMWKVERLDESGLDADYWHSLLHLIYMPAGFYVPRVSWLKKRRHT